MENAPTPTLWAINNSQFYSMSVIITPFQNSRVNVQKMGAPLPYFSHSIDFISGKCLAPSTNRKRTRLFLSAGKFVGGDGVGSSRHHTTLHNSSQSAAMALSNPSLKVSCYKISNKQDLKLLFSILYKGLLLIIIWL